MGIIEEPQTFLYYQDTFPEREPLVLFGGCEFDNSNETTKELIKDLKVLFHSILDSIEQAYSIYFSLNEAVKGISGELNVRMSNLGQFLQESAYDYHSHFGKGRLFRLQMMKRLYQLKKINGIFLTPTTNPPFELFFIHWLETIFNEFFMLDLINAIALNVLIRLGLSAQAHAIIADLRAEISIHVRNENVFYVT